MSKQLSELCALLVRHEHGDLPHLLFSILLEYDRLHIHDLVDYAKLPPRHVQHGLAVLITHKLITVCPSRSGRLFFYQADKRQAYNLVRLGLNPQLISERYGAEAAEAVVSAAAIGVATAHQLGEHVTAHQQPDTPHANGDSTTAVNGNAQHLNEDSTNGVSDPTTSPAIISDTQNAALQQLQADGFLEEADLYSFMSPVDFDTVVGDWMRRNDPAYLTVSGPKKTEQFRVAREEKKTRVKRGLDSLYEPDELQAEPGQAEPDEAEQSPRKKRKVTETTSADVHVDDKKDATPSHDSAANGLFVQEDSNDHARAHAANDALSEPTAPSLFLSQARFTLAHRTGVLTKFASQRLGSTAGQVYNALLQVLEAEYIRINEQKRNDMNDHTALRVDASQVVAALPPSLSTELAREVEARQEAQRKQDEKDDEEGDREELETTCEGRKRTASPVKTKKQPINGTHKHKQSTSVATDQLLKEAVKTQLNILFDDPHEFVHFDKHFKAYSVDHKRLIQILVQSELEKIINARFGATSARMIRILHEKGKLEEKTIGELGFVGQKEVRQQLAWMQELAYLEVQEVPRDNSRQANRNIYLWSYDRDHTRDVVLERVYKMMCRLLQRYNFEKEAVSSVLAKASRTDVQGHEDEYLSVPEKEALAAWEKKENKITTQLSRLDELVLIMRDSLEGMDS